MSYNDIDQNQNKVPEMFIGNRANYSAQVCIYVFFKGDSKWHKRPVKRILQWVWNSHPFINFLFHLFHESCDVLCSISYHTFINDKLPLSQAKLLFMPVQGSFLSGVGALLVFVLLLMLQSGVIAGSNMYL